MEIPNSEVYRRIISIEPREVERRLLRACLTVSVQPNKERAWLEVKSLWPLTADDPEVAYGYTDIRIPKFAPTREDCGDYLTALKWLNGFSKRDIRLVFWRAFGLSWRQIAMRIYKSHETARAEYKDIMLRAWAAANTTY